MGPDPSFRVSHGIQGLLAKAALRPIKVAGSSLSPYPWASPWLTCHLMPNLSFRDPK